MSDQRDMSAALARHLVRPLIERHPLPWRLEYDWTVEVTDARDAIVVKLPSVVEAEELIAFATALAEQDARGQAEIDALLNENDVPPRSRCPT